MTGRAMVNDPLAVNVGEKGNENLHTDNEIRNGEEFKNHILEKSDEGSDLESKLNKLKGNFFLISCRTK